MKKIIYKLADCSYNVSAGCIIVSFFEDKANSIYISFLSLAVAIILSVIANALEKKEQQKQLEQQGV